MAGPDVRPTPGFSKAYCRDAFRELSALLAVSIENLLPQRALKSSREKQSLGFFRQGGCHVWLTADRPSANGVPVAWVRSV